MKQGSPGRIHLSPPSVSEHDVASVSQALLSGWLAPIGPDLVAFETEVAAYLGVNHAVGLSSGTAALHLGLKYLGVGPGDCVIVPTATFAAPAFAAEYLGAQPVFVDIDPDSWNMDAEQVCRAITDVRAKGGRVAAIVPVDLYGATANYPVLQALAQLEGIPVFADAAEALGADCGGRPAGSFGVGAALSFNGNKIITTAGGGMVVTDDAQLADKVRFWATQSRADTPWYEHHEIGFNVRMSNILAALGRAQLPRLDAVVEKRRTIREWYRERLCVTTGVHVQGDPPWGRGNGWLTVAAFSATAHPDAPTTIRLALEREDIESRPTFKPMHQQPVYESAPAYLTGVADQLFREGLCLPSGTDLQEEDVERICGIVNECLVS